jgi:hypothetical protein
MMLIYEMKMTASPWLFFLRQPEASSEFLSTSPGRSQFFGARQMLEPLEKR